MTNRQWLLEKMQNMSDEELAENIAVPKELRDTDRIYIPEVAKWLGEEHKEPIKLSDVERVILENIDKDFKWIVRRREGNLIAFKIKPNKTEAIWSGPMREYEYLNTFNHLFQFIKWEDENPYKIEELLKGE